MAVAVAVAVSEGGAVAVALAGLAKRFFNHIQKNFLTNVRGYLDISCVAPLRAKKTSTSDCMKCPAVWDDDFGSGC